MGGNFLNVGVALEVTARYVEGNVGRIQNSVQECKELRHNTFYAVGNEHLIAVELNLVFLDFEVCAYFGEIEYAGEVERVVDIEVDVEQRFLKSARVEFFVESLVILFLNVGGFLGPQRFGVVDDFVLVGVHVFVVFPLFLFAKTNRHGEEHTVFFEKFLNLRVFEVSGGFAVDMQNDVGAAVGFVALFHSVFGRTVATPFNCLSVRFPTL